jgi:hypothetical protein
VTRSWRLAPERVEPARDGAADPSHAQQSDRAVAKRRRGERIVLLFPLTGAQVTFGLGNSVHSSRPSAVSATSSFKTSRVCVTTMPWAAAELASIWS